MAKSPEANAANSEVIRYDLGWKAINAMLRAGRSLSGHERNCCFLNSREGRFADVSAVAGLDFDDDGRVLALADWDYDGDVDFWIANRSGPQIRYLENRLTTDHRFIAIKLEGVNCNRDAIGSVVELTCRIEGRPTVQTATLKAGEGYLSQNSKWLHFGLGSDGVVETLNVRWASGTIQSLDAVSSGGWYRLREGDVLRPWSPPSKIQLEVSQFDAPTASDAARIVLLNPLPLPTIECETSDGSRRSVTEIDGRAKLVNLWATWCQPCLRELAEWKRHASEFAGAGIDIMAINVDDDSADRATRVGSALRALDLPFEVTHGDEQLVTLFDVIQRSLLSRQRPLPVPSSFLIDREGRLCAIYKGPIDAETILADTKLLDAPPATILGAAMPFSGRWLEPPGGSTPLHLAVKFLEGGLVERGQSYIELLLEKSTTHPEYLSASLLNLYGATLLDQQAYVRAKAAFQHALKLDPSNRQAHIELGTILLRMGEGSQAAPHFESVLQGNANDPELLFKLGLAHRDAKNLIDAATAFRQSLRLRPHANAFWQLANVEVQLKNAKQAVLCYESAIRIEPDLILEANNLAWLLATSVDDGVRDGQRAVEVATAICRRSGQVEASAVDTLAAALAEVGDFADALRTARRARDIAVQQGDTGLAARIEEREALYQKQQPCRESL